MFIENIFLYIFLSHLFILINRYFSTAEQDQEMRDMFQKDLEEVAEDEGESWAKHEYGKFAIILLCDQMSRSIFRKTAKAFSFDHISLKYSKVSSRFFIVNMHYNF